MRKKEGNGYFIGETKLGTASVSLTIRNKRCVLTFKEPFRRLMEYNFMSNFLNLKLGDEIASLLDLQIYIIYS